MNCLLLEYLILNFTEKGETVLDPMSGSGSTGVLSALHGRNAVCIELEEKFMKWMNESKQKVESHQTLTPKGSMKNIQGDARQLSTLLEKADVCITSPPYSEMNKRDISKEGYGSQRYGGMKRNIVQTKPYSTSEDNIGNLPHGSIDTVITSPPYEEQQSSHRAGGINTHKKGCMCNWCKKNRGNMGEIQGYRKDSSSPDNISNLKNQSYLEAMIQVYQEMMKVLKPNGKAIIIIKPFIRNKQVIDLPYQTWILLEKCGFKLIKILKLKLQTQSFWRILYQQKYPNVQRINHEYVIVVKQCPR